jgi:hypothetical protein
MEKRNQVGKKKWKKETKLEKRNRPLQTHVTDGFPFLTDGFPRHKYDEFGRQ